MGPKTYLKFSNPERFYMQDGGANRYMKVFLENNRYNRKMPYRMIKFLVKLMGVYCLLFHFFLLWSLYLQEAGYNRVGIIVKRVRMTLVFLTLISDSTSSTFLKHRSTCTHVAPWNISTIWTERIRITKSCVIKPSEFVSYKIDTETTVN